MYGRLPGPMLVGNPVWVSFVGHEMPPGAGMTFEVRRMRIRTCVLENVRWLVVGRGRIGFRPCDRSGGFTRRSVVA